MSYWVSVKDKNGNYKHFKVQREVYIYIKQLEMYIRYPGLSKLKKVYSDSNRFKKSRISDEEYKTMFGQYEEE